MENSRDLNINPSLEEQVNSLQVEKVGLQNDIAQAMEVIADLKKQNAILLNVKAAASARPTVEVDGVTYEVRHGAAPYTVSELAANPGACREILAIEGQNALTKL